MTVAPGDSCATPSAATSLTPTYTGRELDQAVHAALRRWANVEGRRRTGRQRVPALYQNVQKDTTLAFVTRKQLAAKLRYRLAALVRDLDDDNALPASVAAAKARGVLAQRAGGPNPAQGGGAGQDDANDERPGRIDPKRDRPNQLGAPGRAGNHPRLETLIPGSNENPVLRGE